MDFFASKILSLFLLLEREPENSNFEPNFIVP